MMELFIPILIAFLASCDGHPLDDYVNTPDPAYSYEEIARYEMEGHNVYIINMTSQTWMTEEFSNMSTWFHYISIVLPHEVLIPDQAYFFVGVGHNWHDPPTPDTDPFLPILGNMSESVGAAMTMISQIPNQPCVFGEDASQRVRTEDDIIAWTWGRYMNMSVPADEEQLLYFPMTKAAVRGMDTIAEFSQQENPIFEIDKFIIGGPSKRGWTTYLTAAVDARIVGMTPMVISCLNLIPNLHHHYQSLGGWSWAFQDYWREGLTERLDSPEAQLLADMQDPYTFMDRYTMPALIIKAGNDEFFMLDDFQFFINDFPVSNTTNSLSLENTNHVMAGQWARLESNIETFFLNVYYGYEWPEYSYILNSGEDTASIEVTTATAPVSVVGWVCTTRPGMDRRDYRWLVLNDYKNDTELNFPRWSTTEVEDLGDGRYRLEVDAPAEGWTGFFITLEYDAPDGRFQEFSTEPLIVPESFPFEDCEGTDCKGELV